MHTHLLGRCCGSFIRPHTRGWAAGSRALGLEQDNEAWHGQGWAVTRDVALRGTWQDQGEAAQHITQPGTQADPDPPAGPGALGDVPQAQLGGPSEPQLPGLHHENYPFLSLQCRRDYMRACVGHRASKLAHGRGSVVERGRLSVQRGGNKGPAETGDRRHRQGSDQRRAFGNVEQGPGAAEETGWSSRMAEVRCRAGMEPGLWPEGSNGSAVAKAWLVQMRHRGGWSGSPCPSLRSPR